MAKEGKAYGFLKCDKSLAEIRETIPIIRRYTQTPSKLELSIVKGIGNIQGDRLLHETVISELREEGQYNYAFEARLEGADNRETAKELRDMLNNTYQSTLFEQKPQAFYSIVVYERNGQYVESD